MSAARRGILLVAIGLAGACGGGSDHNAQDVSFARDMVPHHQQAVTMADLALTQSTNPQVQDLATRIKLAQGQEISLLNAWLAEWDEQATDHAEHSGGGKGSKGMVSGADLGALETAQGPEFDRLFLRHMTAHHRGALEMAKAQLDGGRYEPAKVLAREITAAQQREITEMAQILGAMGAPAP